MSASALHVFGATSRGASQPTNEDAIVYVANADGVVGSAQLAQNGYLLLLSDGGGGSGAAPLVQEFIQLYYAQVGANLAENLRRAVHEANARAHQRNSQTAGRVPSGATLVAAVLHENLLYLANVGDSRAYLLRADQLWQLTRDHAQADGKPSRLIGVSPFLDPDIFLPLNVVPGDRLLLCSDGLTDMLTGPDSLASAAAEAELDRAAEGLLEVARGAGSEDDISVIIAAVGAADGEPGLATWQRAVLGLMGAASAVLLVWFLIELWLTLS